MINSPSGRVYSFGRLCALAAAPLCLYIANNYFAPQAAIGLAVAFLASNLAMAGIAANVHRRFYLHHFDPAQGASGMSFYLYGMSLAMIGALGCFIVFAIIIHFTRSIPLGFAGVLFFASKKLADEVLRLRLFEREFASWGRLSILSFALNGTGLAAVFLIGGAAAPASVVVAAFAVGNLLVFIPELPRGLGGNLSGHPFKLFVWLARRASRSLVDNWVLWAIALLGSAVGYLDRLGVLVLDKETLPLFMLVVMCFSIVQISVDYFFVSRMRRDFLEHRMSVGQAFGSWGFLVSAGAGLVLASAACAAVLASSRGGAEFPLTYVLAVAALQISFAGVAVPLEILFWRDSLTEIFRIELGFWGLLAVAVLLGRWFSCSTAQLLLLAVACAFSRLLLYVGVAVRTVRLEGAAAGSLPSMTLGRGKRALDVVGAALGLTLLSPVLLLVAAAVRLGSRGPVLYFGKRIGVGGTSFHMLKFRTMIVDAERVGGSSSSEDDRRITKIGKILRRWKLDELPQLWNVLVGDMSFVGPRPQVEHDVLKYTVEERLILTVRPGITDWSSIKFRNEGEILKGHADPDQAYIDLIRPEKLRLQLLYVREQSFVTDVKIFASTIGALLGIEVKLP